MRTVYTLLDPDSERLDIIRAWVMQKDHSAMLIEERQGEHSQWIIALRHDALAMQDLIDQSFAGWGLWEERT